jgi:hypothetical protein
MHDHQTTDAVRHCRSRETSEHDHKGESDGEPADLLGRKVQRRLGQHEERARKCQVVAFDKADEPEHDD